MFGKNLRIRTAGEIIVIKMERGRNHRDKKRMNKNITRINYQCQYENRTHMAFSESNIFLYNSNEFRSIS